MSASSAGYAEEEDARVEPAAASEEPGPADVISILVATDVHLGYAGRDQVRYNDSMRSFEEVLQLAQKRDVDMILLGGDLFHDNKPSRKIMHQCMDLLRHYCLGDRPCPLQILSDQAQNFPTRQGTVNYEDPNYNVGIPVFSIHGNHDDPAGDGNLCALDLLSVANFVNYFGKTKSIHDITISPILIQKGHTKLALYGLGSIRDERLHRTFEEKKVKMLRPADKPESWFNLFTIHQNRVKHGAKNYIPETFLPGFLDLVVWGHEHRCEVDIVHNPQQNYFITQPGSTIATSLSEGEAEPKHVALIKIHEKTFKLEKIRLTSVRPFRTEDVSLREHNLDPSKPEEIEAFLQQRVKRLIAKCKLDSEGNPEAKEKLPLIRIRVDYSGGFLSFNAKRFGQQFVSVVANPRDILLFFRKATPAPKGAAKDAKARSREGAGVGGAGRSRPDALNSSRVEDLVGEYLEGRPSLHILTAKAMGQAVQQFVHKDEKDYIKDFVKYTLEKTQKSFKEAKRARTAEDIEGELKERAAEVRRMEEGAQTGALRPEDAGGAAAPPREKRKGTGTAMRKESNDLAGAGKKPATVACASSRAKGSKSKAKAPRGSNRSKPHLSSEEEEEEEFVEESEEEDSPHLTDSSGADREPSPPRGRAAVNDGSRKPGAMRASAPPTRSSGRSTRATADLKRHYMGDPESEESDQEGFNPLSRSKRSKRR